MAKIAWREASALDPSLLSLNHFFSVPPEYAQTLTGGLTNRCWKIVAGDRAFVWRPATPIPKLSLFLDFKSIKSSKRLSMIISARKPNWLMNTACLWNQ